MSKNRITNKDIAAMAGVSPAAVSIAMNNREGISQETRERILKIAKEHNYVTGATSVNLLKDRPKYVAILFRTDAILDDQIFYSEMAIDAMVACREKDYSVISTFVTGEPGMIELPHAITNGDVDGVLVCGDQEPGIYTELRKQKIPFVVLDSSRHNDNVPAIYVDYGSAAYEATKYLIELGHRDIAFMGNGALHDFNAMVLSGFQRAIGEAGFAIKPNRIQIGLGDDKGMKQCVDNLLSGASHPTAIFCTVDAYAINIIRYIHTCGLKVPDDISIVSIDDILMSGYIIPSLSSMRVDRRLMISEGLEILDKLIAGEKAESVKLPPLALMIRESTSKVNLQRSKTKS